MKPNPMDELAERILYFHQNRRVTKSIDISKREDVDKGYIHNSRQLYNVIWETPLVEYASVSGVLDRNQTIWTGLLSIKKILG